MPLSTKTFTYPGTGSLQLGDGIANVDVQGASNVIIQGYTSIAFYAFRYNTTMTSITIPSSLTSIGEQAFYFSSLTSVSITRETATSLGLNTDTTAPQDFFGTNVTLLFLLIFDGSGELGDGQFALDINNETDVIIKGYTSIAPFAFLSKTSIKTITIPSTITSIGEYAFTGTTSLKSITVEPGNPVYSSDAVGVLFDSSMKTLIKYPIGITNSSYTIPSGVTSIGIKAFENVTSLTSITLPSSLISIDDEAFFGSQFTSLTIPDNVTSIGVGAFYYASITSVSMTRATATRLGLNTNTTDPQSFFGTDVTLLLTSEPMPLSTTITLDAIAGWNLIGIPLIDATLSSYTSETNMSRIVDKVYANHNDGNGYVQKTSTTGLTISDSYWIHCKTSGFLVIEGTVPPLDLLPPAGVTSGILP